MKNLFWCRIKELVCVCGIYKCDTDDCRLVQQNNKKRGKPDEKKEQDKS